MIVIKLVFMGFFASVASFFLKKATQQNSLKALIISPFIYAGITLYVLAAFLNFSLLKVLPYSVVVPLGSLTYIWTLMISYKFLNEKITAKKVAGIVIIFIGVGLTSIC